MIITKMIGLIKKYAFIQFMVQILIVGIMIYSVLMKKEE